MKNTSVFISALLLLVGVLFFGVGEKAYDIMGAAFVVSIIPVNTAIKGKGWFTAIGSLIVAALFISSLLIR